MSLLNHSRQRQDGSPTVRRNYTSSASACVSLPDAVIAWYGDVDIATAPGCRQAVDDVLASEVRSVALDLRAVDFLDSSGLAVLGRLLAGCRQRDASLVIVDPPRSVRMTLQLTGFLTAVPVATADDVPAGTAALLER